MWKGRSSQLASSQLKNIAWNKKRRKIIKKKNRSCDGSNIQFCIFSCEDDVIYQMPYRNSYNNKLPIYLVFFFVSLSLCRFGSFWMCVCVCSCVWITSSMRRTSARLLVCNSVGQFLSTNILRINANETDLYNFDYHF